MGTYVACRLVPASIDRLKHLCEKHGIEVGDDAADDFHTTVIYSKKNANNYDNSTVQPIGIVNGLKQWKGHDDKHYLVASVQSRDLEMLHNKWKRRGCEHSFPDFQAHITLITQDDPFNDEAFQRCHDEFVNQPLQIRYYPEYNEELRDESESESESTDLTEGLIDDCDEWLPGRTEAPLINVIDIGNAESATISMTLPKACNEFFLYNKGAIRAKHSPEDAQMRYPGLVKRLHKFLKEFDFDAKIYVFKGFKAPIEGACKEVEAFRGARAKDLEHAVVLVGGLCIDPCKLRIGANYYEGNNYPLQQAMREFWTGHVDVSHLTALTPEIMRKRLADMTGGMQHGKTMEEIYDDATGDGLMEDVIHASSVREQIRGYSVLPLNEFEKNSLSAFYQMRSTAKTQVKKIKILQVLTKGDPTDVSILNLHKQFVFKAIEPAGHEQQRDALSGLVTTSLPRACYIGYVEKFENPPRRGDKVAVLFSELPTGMLGSTMKNKVVGGVPIESGDYYLSSNDTPIEGMMIVEIVEV